MKAVVVKVDIHDIDEWAAKEMLAEFQKLGIVFSTEYPRLNEFRKILNGCFATMTPDVHYISKRESKTEK